MSTEITTIIFDADHTLYTPESEEAYRAKFKFLAKETGKRPEKLRKAWDATIRDVEQTSDPGEWERKNLIAETLDRAGATPDERIISDAYSVFWESVANNTRSADGVAGMLRQLRNHGFNLAIATDEFHEPLRIKLGAALHSINVDDLFDVIITPEETGTQKPSESFYQKVLQDLNAFAGQTIMIGDSWERDLSPAEDLGLKTVLVDPDAPDDASVENDSGTSNSTSPETDDGPYPDGPAVGADTPIDGPEIAPDADASDEPSPDYRIQTVTELMRILNEVDAL